MVMHNKKLHLFGATKVLAYPHRVVSKYGTYQLDFVSPLNLIP